jgi:tetratricopeptide (TPR) repeat protein
MRPLRVRMLIAWAVALVLGLLVFRTASYCARAIPRPSPLEELAYYPSGQHLQRATLGHAESAADLAWLRAVQYYGEHRKTDNRFEKMYHVFDILTTLAPNFESAFVFGAFALAQEGRDFPRAAALMAKGLDRNPRSGRLAFEAGFLYYVKPGGRDLDHAAEYFERASRLPGAPTSSREFAAFAHQNTGSLAVAYQLWREIRETSPNRYLREIADREMARIADALRSGHAEDAVLHLTTPQVVIKKTNY